MKIKKFKTNKAVIIISVILIFVFSYYLIGYIGVSEDKGMPCGEIVTDNDGNKYNTVKIGSDCWFRENLKSKRGPDGKLIKRNCYNDDEKNCDIYGGLYDWKTAQFKDEGYGGFQGICPAGWHIPFDSELNGLLNNIKSEKIVEIQKGGSSGFDAVLSGYKNSAGGYFSVGEKAKFWSSTNTIQRPWYLLIDNYDKFVNISRTQLTDSLSVRCLKNDNDHDYGVANRPKFEARIRAVEKFFNIKF